MPVQKSHYEACLAEYSNSLSAIALLKQHRPYLEMIPSLRRPDESVITIPLPIARLRSGVTTVAEANRLPCDLAILMCDPEWKIKTSPEILIFIHRPHEDFSDFLGRWRQTQVWLDKDYEWVMPKRYTHILSEGTNIIYPLFVVFSETPERIKRGLTGADLPFIIQTPESLVEENTMEIFSSESP
ncbi:hypothetical protein SAMD00079811_15660 [Scytonema sp. HK-05]|uniref:hypothetical protein n=1 Tax=Scytonema sp. HK-05 TaxID=1137095 RepID=UPI000937B19A|nr:hypothetical protein [Scytonema sp. HK-05]OKH58369.1 hypothetical protein NIES2130_14950 [Scytonema sp. HK-05]BAY43972.1 hypothetical protein SAMD00079811_15660 [Scytonema sp. HK-05]